MVLAELVDHVGIGDYVITVNLFPGTIDGFAVDMVIDPRQWKNTHNSDLAERFFIPAIEALKRRMVPEIAR